VPALLQVRQMFERFTPPDATRLPEARFDFFRTAVWPRLQEGASGGGLLLVVPDYLDFLRLR
jgi:U3 small nucleolar RNA-associated protein 25